MTIMTNAAAVTITTMSIIITMMRVAAVTSITIITTQTKFSQAGVRRL